MPDEDSGDEWEQSVEARLSRLKLTNYAALAVASAGVGTGLLALKAVTKLTGALSELASLTNGIAGLVYGPIQAAATVDTHLIRQDEPVDETKEPPPSEVAEPFDPGPREASERERSLIAKDPLNPGELAKSDGLRQSDLIIPDIDPLVPLPSDIPTTPVKPVGKELPGQNTGSH